MNQPVENTDARDRHAAIVQALIAHHFTAEAADWCATLAMDLHAAEQKIEALTLMLERCGLIEGGVMVDVCELQDRVLRLEIGARDVTGKPEDTPDAT